jgi:hypothetical protein
MNKSQSRAIRQENQLGMKPGKAYALLRKNLLFHMAVKCSMDVCFKCKEKIKTVEDLSIEHKIPWENRNPKLFWDLENICFSHKICNLNHLNTGGIGKRKNAPEGFSWCQGYCKDFISIELFSKNKSRWNGLQSSCKNCNRKRRARKK